jgi:hypothetical protein
MISLKPNEGNAQEHMTQCSVVYDDNYDDFQLNFIFSQNFASLFWGLFSDETDPMKEMFKSTWHNVV